MIPLLSGKAFSEYDPEGFRTYVRSLYKEPPKAAPPAEYSVRTNAKGNPVITVRRTPKYLTADEVRKVAEDLGWTVQATWMHVSKKKILIKVPELRKKRATHV